MSPFVIISFYKFVPISDYSVRKVPLLMMMQQQNIKGTIILAAEGINASFCGESTTIAFFMQYLKDQFDLSDVIFQETFANLNPFDKSKVKLRQEIVTLGLPELTLEQRGVALNPQEWNDLIADPQVVIIDTRNDYEVKLGTFKGALNPETDNFRDFPAYVKHHLMDKKDQKIAMLCTGGIRCEKSTAYLKELGFNKVYQLKGGIINYLNTIPAPQSQWQGDCFVFDERVALDSSLQSLAKGTIDSEWKNKNKRKK